jgi:hypothetical protein
MPPVIPNPQPDLPLIPFTKEDKGKAHVMARVTNVLRKRSLKEKVLPVAGATGP